VSAVVAVFIIGGRQLGLAVLMHEASHRTLFKKARINDWVGNWLCAYPVWADLEPYRPYHLKHHAKLWTDEDPDLSLVLPFPISRDSLYRKVWRDLSGQTGWKRAMATLRRDLSISEGKVRRLGGDGLTFHNLLGVLSTNLVLFGLLAVCGWPSLYLLWIAAWFTAYSLFMRVRSISEHAMIPDPASVFTNSRTTLASWWERILLAPNRVNYHLEHHLLMRVPHYRLPRFHRMLRSRGALEGACVSRGYLATLALASSRPASVG
ncbi:MAG: fatty acid desaturase family protein, partial [Candidatus Binatia bacterium]